MTPAHRNPTQKNAPGAKISLNHDLTNPFNSNLEIRFQPTTTIHITLSIQIAKFATIAKSNVNNAGAKMQRLRILPKTERHQNGLPTL